MNDTLTILLIVAIVSVGILTSQQVYSQTTLVKEDFYLVELERVPLTPLGSITHESVKCNGGDMLLQASYAVTVRNDNEETPNFVILKELSKVAPNGVAREYEIQIVNLGPQFVNLRLTALCLDMQ